MEGEQRLVGQRHQRIDEDALRLPRRRHAEQRGDRHRDVLGRRRHSVEPRRRRERPAVGVDAEVGAGAIRDQRDRDRVRLGAARAAAVDGAVVRRDEQGGRGVELGDEFGECGRRVGDRGGVRSLGVEGGGGAAAARLHVCLRQLRHHEFEQAAWPPALHLPSRLRRRHRPAQQPQPLAVDVGAVRGAGGGGGRVGGGIRRRHGAFGIEPFRLEKLGVVDLGEPRRARHEAREAVEPRLAEDRVQIGLRQPAVAPHARERRRRAGAEREPLRHRERRRPRVELERDRVAAELLRREQLLEGRGELERVVPQRRDDHHHDPRRARRLGGRVAPVAFDALRAVERRERRRREEGRLRAEGGVELDREVGEAQRGEGAAEPRERAVRAAELRGRRRGARSVRIARRIAPPQIAPRKLRRGLRARLQPDRAADRAHLEEALELLETRLAVRILEELTEGGRRVDVGEVDGELARPLRAGEEGSRRARPPPPAPARRRARAPTTAAATTTRSARQLSAESASSCSAPTASHRSVCPPSWTGRSVSERPRKTSPVLSSAATSWIATNCKSR